MIVPIIKLGVIHIENSNGCGNIIFNNRDIILNENGDRIHRRTDNNVGIGDVANNVDDGGR